MERTPQKAKLTEIKSAQQGDFENQLTQPSGSQADVLQLQRTIGNRATVQQLKKSPQGVMQRELRTQLTHAAGFQLFGTSTYGQIKAAVTAYNLMPEGTIPEIRLVLAKLTAIDTLIDTWRRGHMSKTSASESEKADELEILAEEIRGEKEGLTTKLEASLTRQKEAAEIAELKTAADAVGYSALYATPEFTSSTTAGETWLATPVLAPVFRHHIIANQFEKRTLDAFDEFRAFPGGRAAALALIEKYKLPGTEVLNFGGDAIPAFRRNVTALVSTPTAAAGAGFFSPLVGSLTYSINELFVTFRATPAYKRITQP